MLVTDLAVDATGLYQAALQPGGCLAKAHEHDRNGITWSLARCIFWQCKAGYGRLNKALARNCKESLRLGVPERNAWGRLREK